MMSKLLMATLLVSAQASPIMPDLDVAKLTHENEQLRAANEALKLQHENAQLREEKEQLMATLAAASDTQEMSADEQPGEQADEQDESEAMSMVATGSGPPVQGTCMKENYRRRYFHNMPYMVRKNKCGGHGAHSNGDAYQACYDDCKAEGFKYMALIADGRRGANYECYTDKYPDDFQAQPASGCQTRGGWGVGNSGWRMTVYPIPEDTGSEWNVVPGKRCSSTGWNMRGSLADAKARCTSDESCKGLMHCSYTADPRTCNAARGEWYQACKGDVASSNNGHWDVLVKPSDDSNKPTIDEAGNGQCYIAGAHHNTHTGKEIDPNTIRFTCGNMCRNCPSWWRSNSVPGSHCNSGNKCYGSEYLSRCAAACA